MSQIQTITKHGMYHDPNYPADFEQAPHQIELVNKFNEGIKDGSIAMEAVPCLCGSENFDLVSTYDRNRTYQPIVLCRECGLMQCHPRFTEETNYWFYNSDFYRELYKPGGFKVPSPEEFIEIAKARDPLRERALKGLDRSRVKSVAEVGCSNGMNLYGFHQEGLEVFGCDYSPAMIALGCSMGMDLQVGSVELMDDRKFDLIILSHVLEHFRDPVGEVVKIMEHLNEGGALYIEVPDARAFFVSSLQNAHLYYSTPKTLMHFLVPLGLAPVSESNADIIHFGVVFKKTDKSEKVDVSREYAELRKIIVDTDRRDRLKDILAKTGILPVAQFVRNIFVSR
jgi:SAM-dependent methyltransferase